MKFEKGIPKKYRQSIKKAFEAILDNGTDEQRMIVKHILKSKMLVCVKPVSEVKASGITGVIDPASTRQRIADERLGLRDALGEIFITVARETIDTGGQRGCEGTFVHEGRHAYDFARTIESYSNSDVNPLSIFDPTLYELEREAHRISGEYMIQVGADEYLTEGLDLLILGRNGSGPCFVDHDGIHKRLCNNYGLEPDGNQGPHASELLGLQLI
jgi:hypothetical protein